ncbi:GntR family transcriptional regulator [Acinetobacter sp. PS-1]|nr:GntR family transcriptional regulator [Acinetobacter kanungonis]
MNSIVKKETEGVKRRHNGKYVYDQLREEILTLQLKPNSQLDEISLAERFDVSRSPVRDALARLVAEGLAMTLPNRTTIVRPFNLQDFSQYISALDLLQRAVTRLAAANCTLADIRKIKEFDISYVQAAKEGDYKLMLEQNKLLHLEIARAGRNPYLVEYYERLLEEGQRLFYLHFDYLAKSTNFENLESDHFELIKAISNKDMDRAEQEAHIHTILFRDRFMDHMRENLVQDISVSI